MEDFFKQFRQNLERRPEPGFEERDWQDLQERLDRQAHKRRPLPLLWWWLALPLLLVLMGSNAWFFRAMQQANRKIAALEIRRDTILQTQVIYFTDTIYRTRVVRERVVEYVTATAVANRSEPIVAHPPGSLTGPHFATDAPDQKGSLPNDRPAVGKDNTGLSKILKNEQVIENHLVATNIDRLPLSNQSLTLRQPTSPLRNVTIPTAKHKKTFRQQIYTMRPKGFQAGITGGWAYPLPFSRDLRRQKGYSVGVEADVEFSPQLRLWADATYIRTDFEASRMGDDLGVPIVEPLADDLVFLKAELPQPSLQYSVGMEYLFRSNHKLRPYLGLGYGVNVLLPYEVVYEFENQALGVTWMYETQVQPAGLLTNFGLLRLGIEYSFSKHWNVQLRATGRSNLEKTKLQSPKMLGLQGGLHYRF